MSRLSRSLCLCLSLVAYLSACAPELAENGVYGCPSGESTDCPTGFTCRSDLRCYGPSVPGVARYAPCQQTSDCADGLACNALPDATWGQCGATCTQGSSTCEATTDQEGTCVPNSMTTGACFGRCSTDDDCEEHQECLTVPMASGVRACQSGPEAWTAIAKCTSPMGQCPIAMTCARVQSADTNGVCSYPCGNSQDGCPGEDGVPGAHVCVALGSMLGTATPTGFGCFKPCQSLVDCGTQDAAFVCAVIRGSGLTQKHCIPSGWD